MFDGGMEYENYDTSAENFNESHCCKLIMPGLDRMEEYMPEWLIPIAQPPFHGARIGGILFRTDTGLAINTKMQVLKEDGTAIPGLYAGWFTAAAAQSNGLTRSSIKCYLASRVYFPSAAFAALMPRTSRTRSG